MFLGLQVKLGRLASAWGLAREALKPRYAAG
jgi:hypothetical protein